MIVGLGGSVYQEALARSLLEQVCECVHYAENVIASSNVGMIARALANLVV